MKEYPQVALDRFVGPGVLRARAYFLSHFHAGKEMRSGKSQAVKKGGQICPCQICYAYTLILYVYICLGGELPETSSEALACVTHFFFLIFFYASHMLMKVCRPMLLELTLYEKPS